MDLTVAICTYDGALRLPLVLDALARQRHDSETTWEVLVVDNNSSDATAAVVEAHRAEWTADVPLRYAFEERQGKTFAMERAVHEARGTWVAFLDDDNVPAEEWVVEAARYGAAHPQTGAFGGQVHGRFEVEPPDTFGLVRPLFALNERTEAQSYVVDGRLQLSAPGAGLVVRRAAWHEAVPGAGLRCVGPRGGDRGGVGEEFELQWYLFRHGWDVRHHPGMHLDHVIPPERFDPDYLLGFARAVGRARHALRLLRLPETGARAKLVLYALADAWRLARLTARYRSAVRTDRFVRTRAEVLRHSLAAALRAALSRPA